MRTTPRPVADPVAAAEAIQAALDARFPGAELHLLTTPVTRGGVHPSLSWVDGPAWDDVTAVFAGLGHDMNTHDVSAWHDVTAPALAQVTLDIAGAGTADLADPAPIVRTTMAALRGRDLSGHQPSRAAQLLAAAAGLSDRLGNHQHPRACFDLLDVLRTAGGPATWAAVAETVLAD